MDMEVDSDFPNRLGNFPLLNAPIGTKIEKDNFFKDDEVQIEVVGNWGEQVMMSYICLPTRKRGKFIPKEAAKLGCKPKLHFKALTDGKDVILEDGTIITPEQVMEPSLP